MYINIPTSRHRRGQKHTRCVDRLEDTKQVTLSSNLLDQHGSKPFVSQLLDNAKEIYFARVHLPRSKKWSLKAGDSASNTHFPRTRSLIGTPEIKATSLLVDATRTPICHSGWKPGGANALSNLLINKPVDENFKIFTIARIPQNIGNGTTRHRLPHN